MSILLKVNDLHIATKTTPPVAILKGVNLTINQGEIHALMGPNGSGKSTLSLALMGHPHYSMTKGSLVFNGNDIAQSSVEQRAKAGIFLAFQNPLEIEGVSLRDFLYTISGLSVREFETELAKNLSLLGMDTKFLDRSLNFGFSGGEKKRAEILQFAMLRPKLAILDEIDSGLDVDALKIICTAIMKIKSAHPDLALLVITHYPRILNYLIPNYVHIMKQGVIAESGTKELANEIEKEGYKK